MNDQLTIPGIRPPAGHEGLNPHCRTCEDLVWGECHGQLGGAAEPICCTPAAASPGPIDPETGDLQLTIANCQLSIEERESTP